MVSANWTSLATHRRWLEDQATALTGFARHALRPGGGFGWLDERGRLDPAQPLHTWITARMTYVFALAHLRGEPGAGPLVDHGLAALAGPLHDARHGGWYASVADGSTVDGTGGGVGDPAKAAYPHAFVVLAAATATLAGRPGAAALLNNALTVVGERFWEDATGFSRESYAADWSAPEPYRGANSSMHLVEAFLAAGDVTGDPAWYDRARRICEHLVHGVARERDWRLPEHFSADWAPRPDYHHDRPADPFRPFGVTVGHQLEWARLLLHVEVALANPPTWLRHDAIALFDAATDRGWAVDGAEGFVYTLDFRDRPVVRSRMHWVMAEAIAAAAVLGQRTGDPVYERWYQRFWDFAGRYLIDSDHGNWHHELDPDNQPATTVWSGKPDVYHAYQAVLLPTVALRPTLARSLYDQAAR
jgi:mannose/cellobiose epimerase-like protein (N-acyl-D-glucosamine 2-epimerase family)